MGPENPGPTAAAAPAESSPAGAAAPPPGNPERHRKIAEAAYFRAEARGFAPGGAIDDWLAAEADIDGGGTG